MNAARPILLLLVGLTTAATGCDAAAPAELGSFRSADAGILSSDVAPVEEPTALVLAGELEGHVVWSIVDAPSGALSDACVAGAGPDAWLVPAAPGLHVLRASIVEPETLEVVDEVLTEVFVEGRVARRACVAAAMPPGILPSSDEVSGIDPTPFYDEVAGIDPTPFALLYEDGTSVSAGCACAYE